MSERCLIDGGKLDGLGFCVNDCHLPKADPTPEPERRLLDHAFKPCPYVSGCLADGGFNGHLCHRPDCGKPRDAHQPERQREPSPEAKRQAEELLYSDRTVPFVADVARALDAARERGREQGRREEREKLQPTIEREQESADAAYGWISEIAELAKRACRETAKGRAPAQPPAEKGPA